MLTIAETVNNPYFSWKQKLEKILHIQDNSPRYIKKNVYKDANVCVILETPEDKKKREIFADPNPKLIDYFECMTLDDRIDRIKRFFKGVNLVGDEGDKYYAQAAASETPTNDFSSANGRQELGNGTQGTPGKTDTYSALIGPVTASRKIIDATYPKTNDGDADNTGAAVDTVSWLTSWTKADFNSTGLSGGVIHNAAASPVAGSVLLTYWTIAAFNKTADDTLKIFINHNMLGV